MELSLDEIVDGVIRGPSGEPWTVTWMAPPPGPDPDGRFERCTHFNGESSKITVTGMACPRSFTFAAWVRGGALLRFHYATIMGFGKDQPYFGFHHGRPLLLNSVIGAPIVIGSWTHIAVTQDERVSKLYVNGVLVGSSPSLAVTGGVGLGIGCDMNRGYAWFQGEMAHLMVFDEVLSEEDIQQVMRSERVRRVIVTEDPRSVTIDVPFEGEVSEEVVSVEREVSPSVDVSEIEEEVSPSVEVAPIEEEVSPSVEVAPMDRDTAPSVDVASMDRETVPSLDVSSLVRASRVEISSIRREGSSSVEVVVIKDDASATVEISPMESEILASMAGAPVDSEAAITMEIPPILIEVAPAVAVPPPPSAQTRWADHVPFLTGLHEVFPSAALMELIAALDAGLVPSSSNGCRVSAWSPREGGSAMVDVEPLLIEVAGVPIVEISGVEGGWPALWLHLVPRIADAAPLAGAWLRARVTLLAGAISGAVEREVNQDGGLVLKLLGGAFGDSVETVMELYSARRCKVSLSVDFGHSGHVGSYALNARVAAAMSVSVDGASFRQHVDFHLELGGRSFSISSAPEQVIVDMDGLRKEFEAALRAKLEEDEISALFDVGAGREPLLSRIGNALKQPSPLLRRFGRS